MTSIKVPNKLTIIDNEDEIQIGVTDGDTVRIGNRASLITCNHAMTTYVHPQGNLYNTDIIKAETSFFSPPSGKYTITRFDDITFTNNTLPPEFSPVIFGPTTIALDGADDSKVTYQIQQDYAFVTYQLEWTAKNTSVGDFRITDPNIEPALDVGTPAPVDVINRGGFTSESIQRQYTGYVTREGSGAIIKIQEFKRQNSGNVPVTMARLASSGAILFSFALPIVS